MIQEVNGVDEQLATPEADYLHPADTVAATFQYRRTC